jgi:hypothetical protein
MRGRDGRPHAQKTGEFLFAKKKIPPTPKSKPTESFWRIAQRQPGVSEFINRQKKKTEAQREKSETTIFKSCVFYFLGFIGRGQFSRYNMGKVIEKNGGRSVLFLTGQVTHVLTRSVCHRKKQILLPWVQERKVAVVVPEFVGECIKAGKLLPADNFAAVQWEKNGIERYFRKEGNGVEEVTDELSKVGDDGLFEKVVDVSKGK